MVSAQGRRSQVSLASNRGISVRRACALIGVARSGIGYEPKMPAKDAPVLKVMRQLSSQYPRYGYRRVHVFLHRYGLLMGHDRVYRLWAQDGLQVPRKRPRRRIAGSRPRPLAATAANEVWAYDFVFDACANGQQLKCLTIIDEYTRESLAIDVAGGMRCGRVIEVLSRLVSQHGAARHLRSDNGPEFISKAVQTWLIRSNIRTALSDPGKPWQNGADESFNGKFRDECLSLEWFRNRTEAKVMIENWRQHYNEVRPHSSLSYLTPVEFKSKRLSTNTVVTGPG